MDDTDDFQQTIEKLKEATQSHPNLCTLWANYLILKKLAYDKALGEAKSILGTLSTTQDPDHETLIALYALSRVMSASNR